MPTWGITETGFYLPRYAEIRAQIVADWRSRFGEDRRTDDKSSDGHLISLLASSESVLWEQAALAYASAFVDTASGASLDLALEPLIGPRLGAEPTRVDVFVSGTPGYTIPSNFAIALNDADGPRFTIAASVDIGGGGNVTTQFDADETGPIVVPAGATWAIVTPDGDIFGVANAAAGVTGRDQETDQEYRERWREATRFGRLQSLLRALDGVTEAALFENDTDTPDPVWNKTHWAEALVLGGDPDEIAQVLWDNKCHGIEYVGNTSGTATDSDGAARVIYFSIPTPVDVWIEIDVTPGEGYPTTGDPLTAIRDAVIDFVNDLGTGADVSPYQLAVPVNEAAAGIDTATIRLGFAPSPVGTATLPIADRDIAQTDAAKVLVVEV